MIQFIKVFLYSQHIKILILPIKGSFKSVYKDWKNVDDFFLSKAAFYCSFCSIRGAAAI